MEITFEQIAEQAKTLSAPDRARLADYLVISLDEEKPSEIDILWANEVLRRRDEVRDGKARTIPGPEALRRVRESISK